MINKNILDKLVQLIENSIASEDWINWWSQNELLVKKEISPRWFLKIKPKMAQGIDGATLISQNNTKDFLKSINQDFKVSSGNNYKLNWEKSINELSEKEEIDFKIYFENNFKNLNKEYPNLYSAIKENFSGNGDIVKKEFSKEDILQKSFSKYLTEEIINYFTNISLLQSDGITFNLEFIDFKNDEYLKIGELWLYNDGDEILIKKNSNEVYLNNIGSKQIKILNNSFYNFIESTLTDFINDN
ncbi:hypothetical protein Q1W71_17975 [Flavobacterium pectinovorum]|uniref:hypothetical protein n=1 Tax=Flavobacterium pectinovorum TaxID=29533 RepID=UPI00265DBA90|nr:hypothetical protein [Flavobacterium pectinovorum]WKL46837.1 hypothetical protein Q1W71_17975 [Flavobacterium pectinovorum]